MKVFFLLVSFSIFLASCRPEHSPYEDTGKPLGQVEQRLSEASGLTASVRNPGMFWTLNDSGNPPEVFLIDRSAKIKTVFTLSTARNRDWEDIALGAGPHHNRDYVYVADIGDNWSSHDLKFIYRFEEPKASEQREVSLTNIDTLILRLPDGRKDAEAIMTDPLTHNLYLVSKREDSVVVYEAYYPLPHDTITMTAAIKLPFKRIVAGSISRDGAGILLKTYEKVYFWKRLAREPIPVTLARKPTELPYEREPQGEAIAWSIDGGKYYTLSEGTAELPGRLIEYESPREQPAK